MALVLLVDDEEDLRRLMKRILELDGHEVTTAENGWEAVRRLREGSFDVIVSDVYMPDVSGVEFLKRLQHLEDDTPVIVVSGGGWGSKEALLEHAASIGAAATIAKPFDAEKLRRLVRKVIEEHRGPRGAI